MQDSLDKYLIKHLEKYILKYETHNNLLAMANQIPTTQMAHNRWYGYKCNVENSHQRLA